MSAGSAGDSLDGVASDSEGESEGGEHPISQRKKTVPRRTRNRFVDDRKNKNFLGAFMTAVRLVTWDFDPSKKP